MLSFRLAREEISRLLSRRILRLALIVLMIVPLLYGALYLWAFWDPYGALDRIPVALVNLDQPVRSGGETLTAGADLTKELLDKGTFAWRVVDGPEAARGVKRGTYYSALTIPRGFSAALATADSDAPVPARLRVVMHESKSMIAAQIEGKVFGEVRKAASASGSRGYFDHMFEGFGDVRDNLAEAADGSVRLADGLADADAGAAALRSGAGDAHSGGEDLASGLGTLADGADTLAKGTGTLASGVDKVAGGARSLAGGAGALAGGADKVAEGADGLADGMATLGTGAESLSAAARRLSEGATQLDSGVDSALRKVGEAAAGAAAVRDGATGVDALLTAYAEAHPEAAADPTFARALGSARAVAAGSADLAAGLGAAKDDGAALSEGSNNVAQGAAQLHSAASRLSAGVADAAAGAGALALGAGDVADGGTTLATGAEALTAGARSAAKGAGKAAKGSVKLARGIASARLGAEDLASGLGRLDSGVGTLASGLGDAKSGSRELANGLTAGVDEVPAYTAAQRDQHAAMMSDPVALDTERLGEVTNYGTGFAPYFIPLALWVGSLIVYLVVNPLPEKAVRSGHPAPIVALSGLLPGMLLAVGQSALMYVVLRMALKLAPVQPVAFFGMVLLTAIVYSAILQWLSVSFGPAGKLLGIVVLMLQLTSAAGTFPLETLPGFFRAISPWLPMTYAVAGLREAISGGDMGFLAVNAWTLAAFGVAAFLGMSVTAWRARSWDAERLRPTFEL